MRLTTEQLDEIETKAKVVPCETWRLEGDEVILDRPATDDDMAYLATMDPATTLALVAEVRQLRATVERVRVLHERDGSDTLAVCRVCEEWTPCGMSQQFWPCDTIQALDGEAS